MDSKHITADAKVNLKIEIKYDWLYPANTVHETVYRQKLDLALQSAAHYLIPVIQNLILIFMHKENQ